MVLQHVVVANVLCHSARIGVCRTFYGTFRWSCCVVAHTSRKCKAHIRPPCALVLSLLFGHKRQTHANTPVFLSNPTPASHHYVALGPPTKTKIPPPLPLPLPTFFAFPPATPGMAKSAALPSIDRGAGLAVESEPTVPAAKASFDGCNPRDKSCWAVRV